MSRNSTRLFYIWDALCDLSLNSDTWVTRGQIRDCLYRKHEIKAEPHSITRNLKTLQELGDQGLLRGCTIENRIEQRQRNGEDSPKNVGWKLTRGSEFSISEVRLLIDSLLSLPMVPDNQRDDLVKHLAGLSGSQGKLPRIVLPMGSKLVNKQFFYTIGVLAEGIRTCQPVSFLLGYLDTNKELRRSVVGRRERSYTVQPSQLVIANSRYYLLGYFPTGKHPYHFRIDLMMDARLSPDAEEFTEEVWRPANDSTTFDPASYRAEHAHMMGGQPRPLRFRIKNDALLYAYDQFGSRVDFVHGSENDGWVEARVVSSAAAMESWALQFAETVEVVDPPEVRENIRKKIAWLAETYGATDHAKENERRCDR